MKPTLTALPAPFEADRVAPPFVAWGRDAAKCINFSLSDGLTWGRVTFEKLDSLRVSRGEYPPYGVPWTPQALGIPWNPGDPLPWVATVRDSPWQGERYEYEKRHYGDAYEFGGDVDEMTHDFHHYVFKFHDDFVEALAAGIWFESSPRPLALAELDASHPLSNLPESAVVERFMSHGITCEVRRNPRSVKQLASDARYCSQRLFQFGAELDGDIWLEWTLRIRQRYGKMITQLCEGGRVVIEFDRLPSLTELRPPVEEWLAGVSERRRRMGK